MRPRPRASTPRGSGRTFASPASTIVRAARRECRSRRGPSGNGEGDDQRDADREGGEAQRADRDRRQVGRWIEHAGQDLEQRQADERAGQQAGDDPGDPMTSVSPSDRAPDLCRARRRSRRGSRARAAARRARPAGTAPRRRPRSGSAKTRSSGDQRRQVDRGDAVGEPGRRRRRGRSPASRGPGAGQSAAAAGAASPPARASTNEMRSLPVCAATYAEVGDEERVLGRGRELERDPGHRGSRPS